MLPFRKIRAHQHSLHPTPIASLNRALEEGQQAPPESTWLDWIWRTDPEEPLFASVLLNRNHLLGLILCRHRALLPPEGARAAASGDRRMTLMAKAPEAMTLRELRDTVDNLLIEWPSFLTRLRENPQSEANFRAVTSLIEDCFRRLGTLAAQGGSGQVLDDPLGVEPDASVAGGCRLTRPCLRRLLGSFLVLYRHLHLLETAVPVAPEPFDCKVKGHHLEASSEDFHHLCMVSTLPVAARLNYKQDFPGMYNHVSQVPKQKEAPRPDRASSGWCTFFVLVFFCLVGSVHSRFRSHDPRGHALPFCAKGVCNHQHDARHADAAFSGLYEPQVVYFHNPQYERRARISLAEVLAGDPVQVLPALCQLYPGIPLRYEEEHLDLSQPTGQWQWLVLPGRIYLVHPDGAVYHSDNITALLRIHVDATA